MVERIRNLCKMNGINIKKLEQILSFGNGTIARWDKSNPSTAKVKAVADHFGVSVEYLMNGIETESTSEDELAEYLEELRLRPETRALLEASRGLTKQQLEATTTFIKTIRGTNNEK